MWQPFLFKFADFQSEWQVVIHSHKQFLHLFFLGIRASLLNQIRWHATNSQPSPSSNITSVPETVSITTHGSFGVSVPP